MHTWDDKEVDWNGINDAANYLGDYGRKWGRLGGQTKEKYGSIRWYANFGYLTLHTLIYPGYVYSKFPRWLWVLDCKYFGPFLQYFFETKFIGWQIFIYNRAYQNALKKWPHLRAELLCSADYPEYIKGATRIEETDCEIIKHVLGWQGETIGKWVSKK